MPQRKVVVIGASAGGVSALERLVRRLPADFPAGLLVVLHISRDSGGILPEILARHGPLPASNARSGEAIRPGHIYVAPPDRHLLIASRGVIQIGHGPKENRFRPAVDPLFRSAALVYGPDVIGVILSGALDDGTAGLCTIKQAGGIAVIQDPRDAEVSSMPRSAARHVPIDYCLSADKIGEKLPQLVREAPAVEIASMSDESRLEIQVAADERKHGDVRKLGDPSTYTCPACHGSLMRVRNAIPERFRCHTGHAYTAISLEDELRDKVENTAWSAVRILQEHAMLLEEMTRYPNLSDEEVVDYRARADVAWQRARHLRETFTIEEEPETAGDREEE